MFIGFVKFEIKQWLSAYQDQFCAWFSLARLPTKTARIFFLDHFIQVLFPASQTGSMPRQDFFVRYLLPSHVKYYLILKTFRHFKTAEGRTL